MAASSVSADISKLDPKQVKLMNEEMLIVVDRTDKPLGTKSKNYCHLSENIRKGLIHRAFSVLLFNSSGKFLISQRSDAKITYPSFVSNACCGHPSYNDSEREELDAIGVKRAARRRIGEELGIKAEQIPLEDFKLVKRFLYREQTTNIWSECELDYILVILKDVTLNPDPNEVKLLEYLSMDELLPFLKKKSDEGFGVPPHFQIIVEHFLFDIWKNLDNLDKVQDHNKIHNFIENLG